MCTAVCCPTDVYLHPFRLSVDRSIDWLVGWLFLLFPGVIWDIMGYESDPLPSYPKLRNWSYSVMIITPHPCVLLKFIYLVLIPPMHQPAHPRHLICLCTQFIDGATGHSLHYDHLLPFDVCLMGCSITAYIASTTEGYSNSLPASRFDVDR